MSDSSAIQLLAIARAMSEQGLNRGTAGNASARLPGDAMLITPSGLPWDRCEPGDMVRVGPDDQWDSPLKPSSEWRIHRDIYRARPDAGAIVHAHSPYATALACHRRPIPPFHYMIARFGGPDVRCAEYRTFGTQALSDTVLVALEERSACLMANHGMIAIGRDLDHALGLAVEFETLCQHYLLACQLGTPPTLEAREMDDVIRRFATYGQMPEQDDAS
ncbi:MAG: class II aldolase/adducin family protein [Rhodocyclaceae bacterium]|nr:class II aldolase/adducin family protein [Rhodocyclaceae bacterium]